MRKNYGSWTSAQRCSARVKSRMPISQVGRVQVTGFKKIALFARGGEKEMSRERHHNSERFKVVSSLA